MVRHPNVHLFSICFEYYFFRRISKYSRWFNEKTYPIRISRTISCVPNCIEKSVQVVLKMSVMYRVLQLHTGQYDGLCTYFACKHVWFHRKLSKPWQYYNLECRKLHTTKVSLLLSLRRNYARLAIFLYIAATFCTNRRTFPSGKYLRWQLDCQFWKLFIVFVTYWTMSQLIFGCIFTV